MAKPKIFVGLQSPETIQAAVPSRGNERPE